MSAGFQTLEVASRVAPLGVRFADAASGLPISDGLTVDAYLPDRPRRPIAARPSPTGVYALTDVPGLRDWEFGAGDDAFWSTTVTTVTPRRVVLEVRDALARFVPFRFPVDIPVRGVYRWGCPASPPGPAPALPGDAVPLFSSATRAAQPMTTVLRADLWDAAADRPASFALVEARVVARAIGLGARPIVRGIADANGRVAIHLPCPNARDFDGASFVSPPADNGAPLGTRTFSVELRAAWLPPAGDTAISAGDPIPDLCAALSQPATTLWQDAARTQALSRITVTLGRDTPLKSSGITTPPSVLLLGPP